jgi:GNAT superfamily N-acetyltransferase
VTDPRSERDMTWPQVARVPLDVQLQDGSQMLIRPLARQDKSLLTGLFSELSFETRYRRFFAVVRELDEARLAFLTELDHHDSEALVAVESVSGGGAGVARYVRIGDDVAEPAVVVADRWQRLGLGSVLLECLTARALEEGIARFRGLVLAANHDAIRLFLHLGEPISRAHGREIEIEIVLSEPDGLDLRLGELLRAVGAG